MSEEILEYARSCHQCQTSKPGGLQNEAVYVGLPRPNKPQQIIAVDIMGPHSLSFKRKQYVIVAVDLFSKHAWTKLMKTQKSTEIAEFLVEDVFKFGVPEKILSDQAMNLQAVLGEAEEMLDLVHIRSSPYYPMGNSAVERLNRTIGEQIRTLTSKEERSWDKSLPMLEIAYNHRKQRSHGYSPFLVHFGYSPRAFDEVFNAKGRNSSYPGHIRSFLETKAKIEKAVAKSLDDYHEKIKHYMEAHKKDAYKPAKYKEGDLVLVKIMHQQMGQSKKLGPKYLGPAVI